MMTCDYCEYSGPDYELDHKVMEEAYIEAIKEMCIDRIKKEEEENDQIVQKVICTKIIYICMGI